MLLGFFSGNNKETATDNIKIPPTIPKETTEGTCKNGANTILNPIKVKIIAKPYFNLLNIYIKLANKKYNDLKPKMANIFDV